ncbi:MAG: YcaQ family DNA glycosylase [Anaerolineales bacterium]|nr:YcaQ family DNA glycosylase [Anaerolineales bacterium]
MIKRSAQPVTLAQGEARNILLAAQGLAQPPRRAARRRDVLAAIRRMAALQVDTINVIARSPYLVLWSRLGDYDPAWLDGLLAEGQVFEYWAHALCFLPREDYPLYRRAMLDSPRGWNDARDWLSDHHELAAHVLGRIRREGGRRSADFETEQKRSGQWWHWKDEKTALECLFITGELMIARRQAFQRVYDLRERVRPDWEDGPEAANVPDCETVRLAQTLRAVEALGVAHASWVPDYFRHPKTGSAQRLEALAAEGLVRRAQIEGLPGPAYLSRRADLKTPATTTTLLSPFDPVVWDRQRARELFNFDYTIEVYTPAAKRRFGYFTLPILHRGALVARLDPKAHRAQGVFEARSLALEPGVKATETLAVELAAALHGLAAWHGTPEVRLGRVTPARLGRDLRAGLKALA